MAKIILNKQVDIKESQKLELNNYLSSYKELREYNYYDTFDFSYAQFRLSGYFKANHFIYRLLRKPQTKNNKDNNFENIFFIANIPWQFILEHALNVIPSIDWNRYPFYNKEKTFAQLKNGIFNDFKNKDLYVIDDKTKSPFASMLLINSVLNKINKHYWDWYSLFRYNNLDNITNNLNKIAFKYRSFGLFGLNEETATNTNPSLFNELTSYKNNELKDFINSCLQAQTNITDLLSFFDDYVKYTSIKGYEYNDINEVKANINNLLEKFKTDLNLLREDVTPSNIEIYNNQNKDDYVINNLYRSLMGISNILKDLFYEATLPLLSTKRFLHHYTFCINETINNFTDTLQKAIEDNKLNDICKYFYFYDGLQQQISKNVNFFEQDIKSDDMTISNLAYEFLNKDDVDIKDLLSIQKCDLYAIINYILKNSSNILINNDDYLYLAKELYKENAKSIKDQLYTKPQHNYIEQDDLNAFLKGWLTKDQFKTLNLNTQDTSLYALPFDLWYNRNKEEESFSEDSVLFIKDTNDGNKCYSLDLKYDKIKERMLNINKQTKLLAKLVLTTTLKTDLCWWTSKINEDKLDLENKDTKNALYEKELKMPDKRNIIRR